MRALTWHGKHDVRVDTVPDPEIINPRDAIIKITSTAICGSDLHLYDHTIPTMKAGDVLGHEFMGEVVEVGRVEERHTHERQCDLMERRRQPGVRQRHMVVAVARGADRSRGGNRSIGDHFSR